MGMGNLVLGLHLQVKLSKSFENVSNKFDNFYLKVTRMLFQRLTVKSDLENLMLLPKSSRFLLKSGGNLILPSGGNLILVLLLGLPIKKARKTMML